MVTSLCCMCIDILWLLIRRLETWRGHWSIRIRFCLLCRSKRNRRIKTIRINLGLSRLFNMKCSFRMKRIFMLIWSNRLIIRWIIRPLEMKRMAKDSLDLIRLKRRFYRIRSQRLRITSRRKRKRKSWRKSLNWLNLPK